MIARISKQLKIKFYPYVKIYRLAIRVILNLFSNNIVPVKIYNNSESHILKKRLVEKNIIEISKHKNLVLHPNLEFYNDRFLFQQDLTDSWKIYFFKNVILDPYFKIPIYNKKVVVNGYRTFCDNRSILNDSKKSINTGEKIQLKKINKYILTPKKHFYAKKRRKISEAIILTGISSDNYFHWFFDNLNKLYYLEKASIKIKNIVVDGSNPFQTQSLKFFNDYNFFQSKDELFEIDKAYVLSNSNCASSIKQSVLNFFEEKILHEIRHYDTPKKILVMRKKEFGRHFINEHKLINYLKKFDFQEVYLEDLSFENQVNLFNNALIIVAAHGAGLTNLIFSSSKTTLIEFFNNKYINPCFSHITNIKNIRHYVVVDQIDYGHGKLNGINADINFLKTIIS